MRVIVLNWNSAWFTARCVRSLLRTDYPSERFEIVIVDNASIDGSRERLAHDFPQIRLIQNPANLGFAEACNRAMRDVARGDTRSVDFVALVNNDAVVEPRWLRPLVDAMDTAPDVGAVCPKILLEAPYVDVPVFAPADGGEAVLERVSVEGFDVTRRILPGGLVLRTHPTLPLEMVRCVRASTTIGVPVDPRAARATVEMRVRVGAEPATTLRMPVDRASATRRINSLGTDLTAHYEGYERCFGDRDDPSLRLHEVRGWSGGGVLLRAEMLRSVGVFDPEFFAYYEDTDLAWRALRGGWRTLCEPASVIHHMHGGTAGATARPFFFLNYRNWLLTALRNGTRRERRAAFANALHLSWPYVRRNVVGKVRRLQRPDTTITEAWLRVAAGVAERFSEVRASRRAEAIGLEETDDVVSRWMPPSSPRPPAPRLGGPTVVYVDVTETLRSGWRAGIQRVTCELIRHLPSEAPDVEVVPIVFATLHDRFRRVTPAEYAELLAPTARQRPPARPAPQTPWRRRVGRAAAAAGLTPLAEAVRRRKALAAEPALHRELLLDRLEAGTVFLDVDATWNMRAITRRELLPRLAADGIRIVQVLYDVLPITRPEWFEPTNAALFAEHVDAHAANADQVLAISEDTAAAYRGWLGGLGRRVPPVAVVPLGAELPPAAADGSTARAGVGSGPFLLVVGTVEPRKNHPAVLDAFEMVRADHPELELVVVGRPGWRSEATINRLRRHVAAGDGVHWLDSATDAELEALYREAFAVVAASHSEGFGLPVAEALARGRVVLSSTGGALREAGGDVVEYFDPARPEELAALIRLHLEDPDHHADRLKLAAAAPERRWADLAKVVASYLTPAADSTRRPSTPIQVPHDA